MQPGLSPAFVRKVREKRRFEERQRKAQETKRQRELARAKREAERLKKRRAAPPRARRASAPPPADISAEFAVITVRGFDAAGMDTVERVARENGVSAALLIGDDRRRSVTALRHMAIRAVADAHPTMSTVAIGWLFGGRDHTTIVSSLKKTRQSGQAR